MVEPQLCVCGMYFAMTDVTIYWGMSIMRKILAGIAGFILLVSMVAFAADLPGVSSGAPGMTEKAGAVKTARMNARGKVVEMTEVTVRIERQIKGASEMMDFQIDGPLKGIAVNDVVKIAYTEKSGKLIAIKIVRVPQGEKNVKR